MVFDNPFLSENQKANFKVTLSSKTWPMGAPLIDRVLSFVIDMSIILPLSKLILAPYKKQILSQMVDHSQISTDLILQLFTLGCAYLGVYIFFHALMLSIWGFTIGQKVLGIRVVHNDTQSNPSFLLSIARGLLLVFGILLGGWPLLAALGHSRRMCFHDLATDTMTVSRKSMVSNQNYLLYRPLLRTYYLVTFSLVLTVTLISLYSLHERAKIKVFSFLTHVKPYCESLPEGIHFYDSAISGFLIGAVTEECLLSFQDEVFSSPAGEFDPKWSYMAKYLAYQSEPILQADYSQVLCQNKGSQECFWVRLFKMVQIKQEDLDYNPKSLMERILLIRANQFFYRFQRAYELAQGFPNHETLNQLKFSMTLGFEAIKNQDSQMESILMNIFDSWGHQQFHPDALEMMCDFNLSNGCSNQLVRSCKKLASLEGYLEHPDRKIQLTRLNRLIQASVCDQSEFKSVTKALSSLSAQDQKQFTSFISALKGSETNRLKSFHNLRSLASESVVDQQRLVRAYQVLLNQGSKKMRLESSLLQQDKDTLILWAHALKGFEKPALNRALASEAKESL
jgi:uncharacterized RDD family membrane protein YckC